MLHACCSDVVVAGDVVVVRLDWRWRQGEGLWAADLWSVRVGGGETLAKGLVGTRAYKVGYPECAWF